MATKLTENCNFVTELQKTIKSGKRVEVYTALLDSDADVREIKTALDYVGMCASGCVFEEEILNCRHESKYAKIRTINETCGFPVFSSEAVAKRKNEKTEIFIIVKIDFHYIVKILNYFTRKNVDATIFHIDMVKYKRYEIGANGHLPTESGCCGCGACAQVCPVGAISMQYNENHFLVPVIDAAKCINCKMCEMKCPSMNTVFENSKLPKVYSANASDEIRSKSSSGGMFTLLAEYVFAKGGSVCGAAFDEQMKLKHIVIDSMEEIDRLRGSKYLQSDMSEVYRKVKSCLDADKYMLFVGTPCQVAAMKSYLGKKYDKLITADLLCHGTPSQLLFEKYLADYPNADQIRNVEFRSKQFGWSFSAIKLTYQNGDTLVSKMKTEAKDKYMNAFIDNWMMREMCYDCVFNNFPRQGDFSIGDFWHPDMDPECNDRKGTSIVFVNNPAAEAIFAELESEFKYYKLLIVKDINKIPNRVGPKTKKNVNRARFLELLRTQTFTEAYDCAKQEKYDIGLPVVWLTNNIGSMLTYYSMFYTLSDMGLSVLPIECPLDSPFVGREEATTFIKKWIPEHAFPVRYSDVLEMRELNIKCERFVVGSDQVFMQSMGKARNYFFMLHWVDENKSKISYATSYGGSGARGTEEYYQTLKYYLNRFDFISCREDDGVRFANEELKLDREVKWCIDPVFLCDKKHFYQLVDSVEKVDEKEYIGGYVLKPRKSIQNLLTTVQQRYNDLAMHLVGGGDWTSEANEFHYSLEDPFPLEKTLNLIFHSKIFVTDSFHGVCFAIIFRKDFLVCPRDFRDRFDSILGRIGLEDRIVSTADGVVPDELFSPIDYDVVYEKLDAAIATSRGMLKEALGMEREPRLTDSDIRLDVIREQRRLVQEAPDGTDCREMLKNVLERLDRIEEKLAFLGK